jgi:hypothetical protein
MTGLVIQLTDLSVKILVGAANRRRNMVVDPGQSRQRFEATSQQRQDQYGQHERLAERKGDLER